MIDTYIRIGRSAPDAKIETRPWGTLCYSSTKHPVGNFAIVERVDADSIAEVAGFAGKRTNFFVYTFAEFDFEPDERVFERNGFKHSSMMTSMISNEARPSTRTNEEIQLIEASSPNECLEAARFMSSQFFPRQLADARSVIALSTAISEVPIFRIELKGRQIGAVMIARSPDAIGIYNFCIDENWRGRGFGASAIRQIESNFEPENRLICLQCGPGLVGWYENLGYRGIEHIDVWNLEYSRSIAIIGERGTNGPG